MTDSTPSPTVTPTPLPVSATGSTRRGSRRLVHRVRLEHLAVEFLRLVNALRLPVPIEAVWQNPPLGLWNPESATVADAQTPPPESGDPYALRWRTALDIARALGGTAWPAKVHLMGETPFSEEDCATFARALLVPTPLLSRLSERQKTPELIQTIFKVPLAEARIRLKDLGL